METSKKMKVRTEKMLLSDLVLLETNARFMRHETFQTLVANVKRDGVLTQLPFCARMEDGKYEVLSGNHRVQAAIEAGLTESEVLVTDDKLTHHQRVAIQLSHNSVSGEDDPAVLKKLYESIDSVDWRDYAGLDDQTLELLDQVQIGSLSEANLSFQTVKIVFLPSEADEMREAWDGVREEAGGSPDEAWLARMVEHERLLNALDLTSRSYGVKNVAVALEIVLGVFEAHKTDLSHGYLEEWHEPKPGRENAWVPTETLFGTREIPAPAAGIIRRALKQMEIAGDVTDKNHWQALEYWAAEYLAGVGNG